MAARKAVEEREEELKKEREETLSKKTRGLSFADTARSEVRLFNVGIRFLASVHSMR